MAKIELVRVYETRQPIEPHTYLVDRLWPRGISKTRLAGVIWLKEVAPTTELRHWFHANPDNWSEFEQRYLAELKVNASWQPLLNELQQGKTIHLLYGSKDTQHNQAVVLRDFLFAQLSKK